MRPISDSRYEAVLDRIDMDVVNVTLKIALVADRVLPITPLPDTTLSLGRPARRISIGFRQRPDRVEMIRQYNNRVGREGMALPCLTKRNAQFIDVLRQQ